jgi:hypothetical protein
MLFAKYVDGDETCRPVAVMSRSVCFSQTRYFCICISNWVYSFVSTLNTGAPRLMTPPV